MSIEREDYETAYWELFKDAHGYRPRGIDMSKWSLEELKQRVEYLQAEVMRQIDEEKKQHEINIKLFENRVSDIISTGAKSRETAIKWLLDGTNCFDTEELEYHMDIPYGYIQKSLSSEERV